MRGQAPGLTGGRAQVVVKERKKPTTICKVKRKQRRKKNADRLLNHLYIICTYILYTLGISTYVQYMTENRCSCVKSALKIKLPKEVKINLVGVYY